jgi:serine/threonine protein kinase
LEPIKPELVVDRYSLFRVIGAGGMASVYLGRQSGSAGFFRYVAIKRLHPQYATNPEFVAMFLDEARLASHVRDRHVVETLDVVESGSEILMVMELVQGSTLTHLLRTARTNGERLPVAVSCAIVVDLLRGLEAAHSAVGPSGEPLGVIHRDVSPHNVMIGVDGVARVLDFGVAKANGQYHSTRMGEVRGKPAYMAPEHLQTGATPKSDLYSAGIVLWEALTGQRLFAAETEAGLIAQVLAPRWRSPRELAPEIPAVLEEVVRRALQIDPAQRFQSAKEMAFALALAVVPAAPSEVAATVERLAKQPLAELRQTLVTLESKLGRAPVPSLSGSGSNPQRRVSTEAAAPAPARPHDSRWPGFAPSRGAGEITLTGPSVQEPAPIVVAPPKARSRLNLLLALLLASVAVGGLLGVVMASRSSRATANPSAAQFDAEPALPQPSMEASATATSSVLVPSVEASASGLAPVEPAVTASASAQVATLPSAHTPATSPRVQPTSTVPTSAPVPTPSDCDPPYEVDQNGVKRVKTRCFKVRP